MKPIRQLLLLYFCFLGVYLSPAPANATHQEQNKAIRYCIDPSWMPLESLDERGKVSGMVSDFVPYLSQLAKRPFVLVRTTSWESSLIYLREGMCDVIPMMMATSYRRESYLFTRPYLNIPIMIATTYDKSFIADPHALSGIQIGVKRHSVYKELLEPLYPNIGFLEYDTIEGGLDDVVKGKVFGFIDNFYTLGYHIQRHYMTRLKISAKIKESLLLSVAVGKKNPDLLALMQRAVMRIEAEKLESIKRPWLSVTYVERNGDHTVVWRLVIVVFIVGLFLLYRQYVLSKYNTQLQTEVLKKVDELRKKDELLVQKLRMAAMGEMLSMIAHQWRQPLSAINSTLMSIDLRLKLGRYDLEDPKERESFFRFLHERHRRVEEYTKFLSHTIDDFRYFFSPNRTKRLAPIDEPVKRALSLISDELSSKGIEVRLNLRSNVEVAMFDNEMMQVVLNILKNSEDHFHVTGKENAEITVRTESDEKGAKIVICDNGGGIPDGVLPKIFDPYFSTKEEQNGVGLGLYMSKEIVEKHHGGGLSVENGEAGACFTIWLPLTQ